MDVTTTAGTTSPAITPGQSTLSASFGPYVQDMLSKGWGAANQAYQPFTDERFAGTSPLQQQAFTGYGGLQAPGQFGTATNLLTQAGQRAGMMGFGPSTFGNFYQAPSPFETGQFTSGFNYQPGQINTGLGPVGSVESYMNPYTSHVTDIAARELRRQADISRQIEQARLAKAGAYGGSRQAIMEAERQRNLSEQIGDINVKGLQAAFDQAQKQRLAESQLGLTAQEASERARQFGAERSAQFGLDAQKAQELSRQFGAQQAAQSAQLAAQYGLAGAQQTEASRQFGANFGLQALQQQIAAAQGLTGLGAQQSSAERQNLADVLKAGETQRGIAQQPLDFGYQQFQESLKYPYQQATYMQSLLQGLPLEAPKYNEGDSLLGALTQGGIGGLALYQMLFGNQPGTTPR